MRDKEQIEENKLTTIKKNIKQKMNSKQITLIRESRSKIVELDKEIKE